jgi:hypothetical protein
VAVEVHAEWRRGMSWSGYAQEGCLDPTVLVTSLPGQTRSARVCAERAELGRHELGITLAGGPGLAVRMEVVTNSGPSW